jgi:PAS domain S-box-containing protein
MLQYQASEPFMNPEAANSDATDKELAHLYKLQVRELEDFALFMTDPGGWIKTWNRGVEKTFGYAEQEWIGQHASIIFNEDDRKAGVVESEMQAAADNGRCVDVRWHQRKDGTRVYMTGVLRGLRDEAGNLIGFSKVFLDDTAKKQLEDMLTRSNAELQQFAFVASHDLQEPLRTLSSFSQLLANDYSDQLPAQARKMLQFMVEAAQRMSKLTSDLLDYSQLAHEGGRAASVHLDDDLETAITLLRSSIKETDAVITHGTLPNVELDRNQMVRLFQNFLVNAIKFRNPDQPPRIHVSAEQKGDEWIIRVADNGIGIPPEHTETIFQPFKRLNTNYPGSGIGLATCKRIVEGYGGRIGAESQVGEGSIFWFTIPVTHTTPPTFGGHG